MTEFVYYRDGQRYIYDTDIRDDKVDGHPVKMTSFHTVVDQHWSLSHLAIVQAAEREVGHEICGAKTINDNACKKYPHHIDGEPYPSEIGRCEIHRASMTKTDSEVEIIDDTTELIDVGNSALSLLNNNRSMRETPTSRMLMNIAEDMYMRCDNCMIRSQCPKVDENNGVCVIERERFSMLLKEMILEENLTSISDQITAISVIDTVIKMIRTTVHENRFGISEALAQGTAQYNAKLKELLYKGLKTLAIDRKTKISIRRKGGQSEDWDGSIAQALSNASVEEIELKSARMKLDLKHAQEPLPVSPKGIHGEVIKDDVPIERET